MSDLRSAWAKYVNTAHKADLAHANSDFVEKVRAFATHKLALGVVAFKWYLQHTPYLPGSNLRSAWAKYVNTARKADLAQVNSDFVEKV